MSVEIGEIYEIKITDISKDGEGIGKVNGFTLFVKNMLPGEIAEVRVSKTYKNFGFAEPVKHITMSSKRIAPPCKHYYNCGGCSTMHLDYSEGLKYKAASIASNLKRIGKVSSLGNVNITPSHEIFRYRNNMQFPVGYDKNGAYLGLHSLKSHIVTAIDDCLLANDSATEIIQIVNEFLNENKITAYDPQTNRGIMRHISYRTNIHQDEKMITFVINSDGLKNSEILAKRLSAVSGMKSINININKKPNAPTFGPVTKNIWGETFITDSIGKFKFRVSPDAFFQVNPYVTEEMYKKVLEFLNPTKNDEIIDAYCGAGTISIFIADYVKKVTGIEISSDSVKNATENAVLNDISNVEFIKGDAAYILLDLRKSKRPTAIIVDPPRKGLSNEMVNAIISSKIKKIVYVSCDSATFARDIKQFNSADYLLKKIEAFDMFCHSTHAETVSLLEL